jgi:hypothetical protein
METIVYPSKMKEHFLKITLKPAEPLMLGSTSPNGPLEYRKFSKMMEKDKSNKMQI